MPILESVPNVSEGRRESVLEALARRLRETPELHVLTAAADADHNRAVYTLVGRLSSLLAGLSGLVEEALAAIDLRRHAGVHPRIGAVDVVPFVPLGESRMEDAVEAARAFGRLVGERFEIPVFLYEEAASSPQRRNLALLRRGGVEDLAGRLSLPEWRPDFGPARLHPTAGAMAVGARFFLVAFNARLDTPDVAVARRIARAVRESNGGLPAVKAIGIYLESHDAAQVSMNLVDYRRTDIPTVVERIRAEAAPLGARVVETEVIGLVPEAALGGVPPDELQIGGFTRELLLDEHLERLGLEP